MIYEIRLCEWKDATREYVAVGPVVAREARQSDAERLAFRLNIENKYKLGDVKRYLARRIEGVQGNE